MSTTVKFTATREAKESAVEWPTWIFPLPNDHIKTTYIDTGLIVDHGSAVSDTTVSYWFVFKDPTALSNWLDDPMIIFVASSRNRQLSTENIPFEIELS